ncbi:DUF3325 family protein [Paracidovorax avenae]|uniref:DUF3325 family protein n=1 Tax=Paracidovorax avenae TaxID=80867 RepID=UPI00128EA3C9
MVAHAGSGGRGGHHVAAAGHRGSMVCAAHCTRKCRRMSGGALTACAAACLGAAWWLLYLATRRVQDTLPTPISSRSVAGLRIVSAGLGTLAWLACAAADGIAMGTLLWAALWSSCGFSLMALLVWAPRRMGRLALATFGHLRCQGSP